MLEPVLLYLDPGTSATLAQLALAGTAGVAAAAKLRMNKLRRRTAVDKPASEELEEVKDAAEEASPVE